MSVNVFVLGGKGTNEKTIGNHAFGGIHGIPDDLVMLNWYSNKKRWNNALDKMELGKTVVDFFCHNILTLPIFGPRCLGLHVLAIGGSLIGSYLDNSTKTGLVIWVNEKRNG